MKDYKAIFEAVESKLFEIGSRKVSSEQIREELDAYKHLEGKHFSDDEYYRMLVQIIFYAGFRAQTVTDKLQIINAHFPNYRVVAEYGPKDIQSILSDERMIKHHGKVYACVKNAKTFQKIIGEYGSFREYVSSFGNPKSEDNLMRLRDDLEERFSWLGGITTYHFLTDMGMPVLKPDRVVRRIFTRLGLVEEGASDLELIREGKRLAEATGQPIRYIDVVFVVYGQLQTKEMGLESGICLAKNPRCSLCSITAHCEYYARTHRAIGA